MKFSKIKNSLHWCREKTIEVEIILLLFHRSLNWNRCPINGSKCLMHTKFDFKLGNFFFHFFFNFGKTENFRAKILRDDWQTSSITLDTVDWWMLNVLTVIQIEPVSFKYLKSRNCHAKKMPRTLRRELRNFYWKMSRIKWDVLSFR